jgi:hypothetical protein
MKTYRNLLSMAICSSIMLVACQKDSSVQSSSLINTGEVQTSGSQQTGSIQIVNNTPTTLRIFVNDVLFANNVGLGETMKLDGKSGESAKVTIETGAKDAAGNAIGLTLTMNEVFIYPAAGKTTKQTINIPADVYFVYAINKTATPVDELVLNNSLPTEMNTALAIANDGSTIGCGYYPAPDGFTHIRAFQHTANDNKWDFTHVPLTGKENQTVTIDIH